MHKRRAFTIMEFLVVACVVFAMITLLAPFVQMTKARANKIYCANNLRQISLGLHRYALDHKNYFPATLSELYPNYVSDEKVFASDYLYTPGLAESSPPRAVIVQDKDSDHKKSGNNILRVDGSVEWIGGAR